MRRNAKLMSSRCNNEARRSSFQLGIEFGPYGTCTRLHKHKDFDHQSQRKDLYIIIKNNGLHLFRRRYPKHRKPIL